uniref:MYC binding protein n=1 Tax=Neogobius melanostomus TaxID=47308 RepID=A0A8C6UTL8_9GOBI
MASHHRTPNSNRETFRRYLEKGSVIDSLTTVLVTLYSLQEKPSNPLEFIKQHLGAAGHISTDSEALQQELTELRQKCAALTEENMELKAKLLQFEPQSENGV